MKELTPHFQGYISVQIWFSPFLKRRLLSEKGLLTVYENSSFLEYRPLLGNRKLQKLVKVTKQLPSVSIPI